MEDLNQPQSTLDPLLEELKWSKIDTRLRKPFHLSENVDDCLFSTFSSPLSTGRPRLFRHSKALRTVEYSPCLNNGLRNNDMTFLEGGPRETLFIDPEATRAAIVSCGGLCPGINNVIKGITKTLIDCYSVPTVFGVKYGFSGFKQEKWIELTIEGVSEIDRQGGSYLGCSRGGFNLNDVVDGLKRHKVNLLFIIGGDGSLKGADILFNHFREHKEHISVIFIPKTIDNDLPIVDRSFGHLTAVEEAVKAIRSAETEARGAKLGIGLIKLMGRHSGHIALDAALVYRNVDYLLIPEIPFDLEGEEGVLLKLESLLHERRHLVVVVAEGSGDKFADEMSQSSTDPSGNKKLFEIGLFLKKKIEDHFKNKQIDLTLKYIDPSYMIRSIPANVFDAELCNELSAEAVNGAMAGYSGFCCGIVSRKTVYIPISVMRTDRYDVDTSGISYQSYLLSSRQP